MFPYTYIHTRHTQYTLLQGRIQEAFLGITTSPPPSPRNYLSIINKVLEVPTTIVKKNQKITQTITKSLNFKCLNKNYN